MFGSTSPSLCPAEDKNADICVFFFISMLLTATQVEDREIEESRWGSVILLILCLSGSWNSFLEAPAAQQSSKHPMLKLRVILWGEQMLEYKEKANTNAASTFLAPAILGPPPAPLWPQAFICMLSTGILLISSCGIKSFFVLFVSQSREGSCSWLSRLFLPLRYLTSSCLWHSFRDQQLQQIQNPWSAKEVLFYRAPTHPYQTFRWCIKFSIYKGMTETLQVTYMCHIQHLSVGLVNCYKQDHPLCLCSLALLQSS